MCAAVVGSKTLESFALNFDSAYKRNCCKCCSSNIFTAVTMFMMMIMANFVLLVKLSVATAFEYVCLEPCSSSKSYGNGISIARLLFENKLCMRIGKIINASFKSSTVLIMIYAVLSSIYWACKTNKCSWLMLHEFRSLNNSCRIFTVYT